MTPPTESKPNDLALVKTIKGVLAVQPAHPAPIGGPHPAEAGPAHPCPLASGAGTPSGHPHASADKPGAAQPSTQDAAPVVVAPPPAVNPEADLRAIEAWENEGDPN